jgi:hypothetical protein
MPETLRHPGRLRSAVEKLSPGYFALVMATGIVSIAAHFLGLEWAAIALFWINVVAYGVLWALTLARIALYGRRVGADIADHARGPGFFTLPAGTCVLGAQFVILRAEPLVATGLWCTAIALWLVVTYAFFAAVTIKAEKPPLGEGLNGTWLIAVVAMQSIAVLGCLVAPSLSSPGCALLVAAGMHMGGFMLYLPLIALLLYRWTFVPFSPQQLTPPYWINMGALAISTLAGRAPAAVGPTPAAAPADRAVPGRRHLLLLDGRDLVDPLAPRARVLASRGAARAAHLRPPVLGHGVPARHVHDVHGADGRGSRPPGPDARRARVRVAGARRLGGHVPGADARGALQARSQIPP